MKKIYLNTLTPEEIIRRLKFGDVIHQVDDGYITKMIDGVICEFVGNELVVFNKQLHIDECDFKHLYFEEQEDFKIENVGVYKTRDGRKAFVVNKECDICFGYLENNSEKKYTWTKIGKCLTAFENGSVNIVSDWED